MSGQREWCQGNASGDETLVPDERCAKVLHKWHLNLTATTTNHHPSPTITHPATTTNHHPSPTITRHHPPPPTVSRSLHSRLTAFRLRLVSRMWTCFSRSTAVSLGSART